MLKLSLAAFLIVSPASAPSPLGAPPLVAQDSSARALVDALKSHAVFGKLMFVANEEHPPLQYVFHRPGTNYGAGFERELASKRTLWLQYLEEALRAQCAGKFALQRRPDRPQTALIVMWTAQDYAPYLATVTDVNGSSDYAHFDEKLGAVVTFEYGGPSLAPHWRRLPELTQFVRGELYAYTKDAKLRLPHFLVEGFASYIANHDGVDAGAFAHRKMDKIVIDKLVRIAHDVGRRTSALPNFADLCEFKSFQEQRAAMVKRYGPAVEKAVKQKDALELCQGQAWTLVHFLMEERGGVNREPFLAYMKSALSGDGSIVALKHAFGDADLVALELDYYKWLFEQFRAFYPDVKVDEGEVVKAIAAKLPPGGVPKSSKPAGLDLSAFSDLDVPSQHAALLGAIRAGRITEVLEKLEGLRQTPKIGEYSSRLDREILRCRKFAALREQHFKALAASGARFTFERDGKKISTKVKTVAEGRIFLEDNRAKVESLAFDEIDALEVAKGMDKSLTEGSDGWARWYPMVLAGEAKALKALKGNADADLLREDAESFYPGALAMGAAIEGLTKLGELGEPKSKDAAQKCVDALKALVASHGKLDAVKTRAESLKALAAAAYKQLFEPAKIAEVSAAKVEALKDGRVRFTYEFDKQEEAAEFSADHGYFAKWRGALSGRMVAAAPEGAVDGGGFRVRGAACWRSAWTFADGVSVRYDIALTETPSDERRQPMFAVAVCDDREENFVWCQGYGSLYANDAKTKYVKSDSLTEGKSIDAGVAYSLELTVEGGVATTRESGVEVKKIQGVPHRSGGVFLFVHSDPAVVFDKLVIEGKPDTASVEKAWIAKKVAELKL